MNTTTNSKESKLIAEAYSRVYLKEDEEFRDQVVEDSHQSQDPIDDLKAAVADSIKKEQADFGGNYNISDAPKHFTDKDGNKVAVWSLEDSEAEGGDFAYYTYNFTTKQLTNLKSGTEAYSFTKTLTPNEA